MKESDNYIKLVTWSEEDGCYIGSIPGWLGNCCHGADEIEVYQELSAILDEWIEIYNKDQRSLPAATNRSYSGKFVLRTGADLHRTLALKALQGGESLNSYVVKKLQSVVRDSD